MQAVILVAGKSTRTYPLTLTRPKPLLPIANRTIIEFLLEQLDGWVDEVILVVGYRKEMIEQRLGRQWQRLKITYCEQKEQWGTGHAVLQAEPLIHDRFLALNGDDIYDRNDMQQLFKYKYAALVRYEEDPSQYGVYHVDEHNRVLNLIEKPKTFVGNLTNVGCYLFDRAIFEILKTTPRSERNEIEITSAVLTLAQQTPFYVHPIQGFWLANGFPWELLQSQEFFMKQQPPGGIRGSVESGAQLMGPVAIGENTRIKAGAYIEGPVIIGNNCIIGPNCFIRGYTSIGDNCMIGHSVEIKNSIIMNNTRISHLSYVGDSVIGEGVNLGAGFISANVRHDGQHVLSQVKGKLFDTGRTKLGTIIGDGVKTGIRTSVYPGRKIWPGKQTQIGQIVKYDLTD
ncbi:MAG: sugar phosphate nucleotidyltransferase [candidate division KSB1 bacterium]|nr:sugar phosphate nucleotidyltransferase [candidate division KSB1 bacterium]